MEPAQPLAPPNLDATIEEVTVYVDGLPPRIDGDPTPTIVASFAGTADPLREVRPLDGLGPLYLGLADRTVLRVTWDPELGVGPFGDDFDQRGGWRVHLALEGSNLTGADTVTAGSEAGRPNRTEVAVLRGERLRPAHVEPASPAAPNQYRHRAYVARTATVGRWWRHLADEYTWLPPGWSVEVTDDGRGLLWPPRPITGSQLPVPLVEGAFLAVIADPAVDPDQAVEVYTQRQLITSWVQTTGPTLNPVPPISNPEGDLPA